MFIKEVIKTLFFIHCIFIIQYIKADVQTKNRSSKIKVNSGTNLYVKRGISQYKGTIEKDEGAYIKGNKIVFEKGAIIDSENKTNITGELYEDGKIFLNGNKYLRIKKGSMSKSIQIQGQNNKIEGNIRLSEDIKLLDNTTSVSLAIANKLAVNIQINNGSIYLLEDLNFLDEKYISSTNITYTGIVSSQDRSIILNGDETEWNSNIYFKNKTHIKLRSNLVLYSSWTFGGESYHIIDGNKNILYLENAGQILVDKNSKLLLRNLMIKGLTKQNIACLYSSSNVIFQNVQIVLSGNYEFNNGSFDVKKRLKLSGPYKFSYKSDQISTIKRKASLILENNITFSYDPSTPSKNLIYLNDKTSTIELDGSTIHATLTGMQLTRGTLLIKNESNLCSEKVVYINLLGALDPDLDPPETSITEIDEGITVGNGTEKYDLDINILNGSNLNITGGSFVYKNESESSINVEKYVSRIILNEDCAVKLFKTINLRNAGFKLKHRAHFLRSQGSAIRGSINCLGKIYHETL